MKKLIVTFAILFIVLLFTRILFGYYVDRVPVFGALLTPLTWLTVVAGVLCVLFVVLVVVNELTGKKK